MNGRLQTAMLGVLIVCRAMCSDRLARSAEPPGAEDQAVPKVIKVLYERSMSDEERKRYELLVVVSGEDRPFTDGKLAQLRKVWETNMDLVRIELIYDRAIGKEFLRYSRLGKDRIEEAEKAKWIDYGKKELAAGKNITGFKLTSTGIFYQSIVEKSRGVHVLEDYEGKGSSKASIDIWESLDAPTSWQDFLRYIINCELSTKKTTAGDVVAGINKEMKAGCYAWLSGERKAIFIYGTGDIEKLIPLYAEKFPSTLEKSLSLDKVVWGRQEMDLALARMGKVLTSQPEERARSGAFQCMNMTRFVVVPVLPKADRYSTATLDVLKKQHELLTAWWAEYKEKTYWDEKLHKLVAKGQTPEDISAAMQKKIEEEQKRTEEEMEHRLSAPISDEKMEEIRGGATRWFEERYRARVAKANEKQERGREDKFEKIGEGKWDWYMQGPGDAAPTHWTWTGPQFIERQSSSNAGKRFPLSVVFNGSYYDERERRTVRIAERAYYDKLEDQWREGLPRSDGRAH